MAQTRTRAFHLRRLIAAVIGTIMMTMWTSVCRTATAFVARPSGRLRSFTTTPTRLLMANVDPYGRRIRKRSPQYDDDDDDSNEWMNSDDNDWDVVTPAPATSSGGGGWDDFDPLAEASPLPPRKNRSTRSGNRQEWRQSSAKSRDFKPSSRGGDFGRTNNSYNNNNKGPRRGGSGGGPRFKGGDGGSDADRQKKINLKALEGAGYDHLYGLSPVRNALRAQKRELVPLENRFLSLTSESEDVDEVAAAEADDRKPEAQFRPYLFLQERKGKAGRSGDKTMLADQVQQLAQELSLPVAYVDKGVLNTLSGNRPHQGCVLRCGRLDFEPLSQLPSDDDAPRFWLVLDQIVDPQNLGALLRSAYFFGNVAVLVCAKNSAPPSPTVSASSAGALEDMTVYATNNLPRTLAAAEQDGFRIIGASASSPADSGIPVYDLNELPAAGNTAAKNRPTVLVLGSEGHGIRSLVANYCTEFVKIPGVESETHGVDSLNVSVTGGILMWHLLHKVLVRE